MSKKSQAILIFSLMFSTACQQGFERFAPPANSISGRGAKVRPKIIATTPAQGASISPVTGVDGTQIKVQFDMTMRTDTTPVINTWVYDLDTWMSVANSGVTFTWSSTAFANDTLTIQLGWVRWPENNIIGFDFKTSSLLNLDDMELEDHAKFSFTVAWETGRYKVVPTGQESCYYYSGGFKEGGCLQCGVGEPKIGSYDYPAGQNGFVEPMNSSYGPTFYGASSGGLANGRRFPIGANPQNLIPANCSQSNVNAPCYPYSIDSVTTLIWKTCSQGQAYEDVGDKCFTAGTDFTWGNAVNACASLNTVNNGAGYGGRKDWRLPTLHELETLVDYGARIFGIEAAGEPGTEAPAIHGYQRNQWPLNNEGPFPNTSMAKGYWSSTGISLLNSGQTYYSNAYVVEFKKGNVGSNSSALMSTTRATTNRQKVRCVAGPAVLPQAPSLTPGVQAAGTTLTGNAAAFSGFDSNATFNMTSASAAYDINSDEYSVTVQYNKTPDGTAAGLAANYCIAAHNATTCAASSPTISTALPAGTNAYKLTLSSTPGSNTAYKIFVSNVTTATDLWQAGKAYVTGTFLYDSGSAYRVLQNHTSASIAADILATNLELVDPFAASTAYIADKYLLVPGTPNRIVKVALAYTSGTTAQADIDSAQLTVVKSLIIDPALPLTLSRAFFNGPTRTAAPAPTPAFNVASATAPNLTTVQVAFNRLPNASEGANAANYCIISATANPWPANCGAATPTATITGIALSGYTATLTTTLTAGTAYVVLVSGVTYLGSHIVDDSTNKLRWQRCRRGTFDSPTCGDDGVATNDSDYWNEALNYCDRLNADRYDNYAITGPLLDRYRWRAPTINELKSISNRALMGSVGVSMDTTIFPTPNLMAENFGSSTSYALSGGGTGTPNYNMAWAFNFYSGFTGIAQRDWSTNVSPITKPPKVNIRCVRSLP